VEISPATGARAALAIVPVKELVWAIGPVQGWAPETGRVREAQIASEPVMSRAVARAAETLSVALPEGRVDTTEQVRARAAVVALQAWDLEVEVSAAVVAGAAAGAGDAADQ